MRSITFRLIATFSFCVVAGSMAAQNFIRTQLPTVISTPWEISYGPDNYLWITESMGRVSRVNPVSGNKTVVYTAPDYFDGAESERLQVGNMAPIGKGTLGLALHPDFLQPASAYIYYVYSYNQGTVQDPATKFKIVRLTWNSTTETVTAATDLITEMPTGYDHLGGRLMAVRQNGIDYLYFSVGDNGISEDNSPGCYDPPSSNPNNFTQDPNRKNGKVHRFLIDGSIPGNNPVPGNSMFTRGHRNPQGLMYNPVQGLMYVIEHGDRTDDEINIIEGGKNYGWKNVRGYHDDNNYAGESDFVNQYTPSLLIGNDGLKAPLFSWCTVPQPTSGGYLEWCTVAPSDGLYYSSNAIPEWTNSLLVVTLKNGTTTDQELYQFPLNAPGDDITGPAKKFFGADQAINGRLRDVAVSNNGSTIYLINNGGNTPDKITVYTFDPSGVPAHSGGNYGVTLFPNPGEGKLNIDSSFPIKALEVYSSIGGLIYRNESNATTVDLSTLTLGYYLVKVIGTSGQSALKSWIRN